MAVENFSRVLWPRSRYLAGPPSLVLYVSEKIRVIRHVNRIIWQEKRRKGTFLKIWSQTQSDWPSTNLILTTIWGETFFPRVVENFSRGLWPRSRYLAGPPSLVLYVIKKIRAIRHTNQKILRKTSWGGKKHAFFSPPFSKIVYKLHDVDS